jgi:hypothetical protein
MARVVQVGEGAFGGDYEPIPVGAKLKVAVYEIDVVPVKSGENAGKDQIDYTAKVTEEGEFKGREIRYNKLPLYDGKGAWALVAFAEAVGWKTEKGKGVAVPDDVTDVLGTEFIAKIGQQASQKVNPETGEPYINNRITGYAKLKAGGGGSTPPAEKKGWGDL